MLIIKEAPTQAINADGQEIDVTEEMNEIIRLTYRILQKREQASKPD